MKTDKHAETVSATRGVVSTGLHQAHDPPASRPCGTKRLFMGLAFALAATLPHGDALSMAIEFGTASGFAILAGSGITVTGATTVTGDIGTFPTATITGAANLILSGVNYGGDATTQQAKSDLSDAYAAAVASTPTTLYGAVFDLGGKVLTPGVYNGSSSLAITGSLTLDAQGDPDAVWIFQAASTLTAAAGSNVILLNGAQAANVIWQVGSSATLGTDAYFVGSLLALTSISLGSGATVDGRLLALDGAVTLDSNFVTVPESRTLALFGIGLAALAVTRKKRAIPH